MAVIVPSLDDLDLELEAVAHLYAEAALIAPDDLARQTEIVVLCTLLGLDRDALRARRTEPRSAL